MAETKLAQMIVPTEFNDYVVQLTTEKSRFFQSGIIEDMTAVIDAQLAGKTVNMPFFNDLGGEEEVVDDNVDLTVAGVTTSQDVSVKLYRAKAFGATDLAGDLAGADPVQHIANRIADWWQRRMQAALLSSLNGAMGAASMSGNVFDITGLTAAAAEFDADSFIDAVYKLGDEAGGLTAIAVHSATMKQMVKQDLIDYVADSQGQLTIPTYMGKQVIEDDSMPVSAGNYTTYIFGRGAVGYGEQAPKTPVEVERQALKGGGQEYLVQRRQFVLHPRGIKWVGTSAGPTPTNAELGTATNWNRVYDNKNIRIVAFKHKLAA